VGGIRLEGICTSWDLDLAVTVTFRARWRGRKARGNPLRWEAGAVESNGQLVGKAVEVASALDPSDSCGRKVRVAVQKEGMQRGR
jgi:hypothetical protein